MLNYQTGHDSTPRLTSCSRKIDPWPTSKSVWLTVTASVSCSEGPVFSISMRTWLADSSTSSLSSTSPCSSVYNKHHIRQSLFVPSPYLSQRAAEYCSLIMPPPKGWGIKRWCAFDVWRLPVGCLSRTSGLSWEQRCLVRLKLAQR